jgi:hypothetical protein
MTEVEQIREDYRPERIATLFVGESAPNSGKFFYFSNTNLFRQMKKALGGNDQFLKEFQDSGFFLDDLVLEPVNGINDKKEKKGKHEKSVEPLATRIKANNPEAIVIVGIGIECYVRLAACKAEFNGSIYVVPFPGRPEHQERFQLQLKQISPKLPRIKNLKEE